MASQPKSHSNHTAILFFLVMLVWGLPKWLESRHPPPPPPPVPRGAGGSPAQVQPARPKWTPLPGSTPEPVATPEPRPSNELFAVNNLPLKLSRSTVPAVSPALSKLESTAETEKTAVAWRSAADEAARHGFHQLAARAYAAESAVYRKTGDVQAAEAERMKADSHTATLSVCYQRPVTAADLQRLYTAARLEPEAGCYIGAFINRDDHLNAQTLDGRQAGDVNQFEQLTGKAHATYFDYLSYGKPFPSQWVDMLKMQGAIPHIAWEPQKLGDVADDEYLKGFADAARAADWPIFIRFAGEMNGDWTIWHNDPAQYRKAFRTVHAAFKDCKNVALIWCPNAIPLSNIEQYYPGDDAVDWVGVNFYSVLYLNDDRKSPGDAIHPTDLLDPIYRKYSERKPIAIGEYAATHQSHLDDKARPEFAVHRIQELYGALQTRYPRVKMINWYDRNNMLHPDAQHRQNNYLLTDDAQVLQAYREAVSPPWFLGPAPGGAPGAARLMYTPLQQGLVVGPDVVLRASVRCWATTPHVFFTWDGTVRHATSDPGSYGLHLSNVAAGPHTLKVTVLDDDSRPVAEETYRIKVSHS